ncbi:MAG: hypothetical protein F4W89_08305 [Acidobacteria bacterium]|nr:hypothetical protein [Acidobacteriota bacterium]
MAEASIRSESIPVDLLNPGQVFACLGFLEAADILLGGAAGGFDWKDSEPSQRADTRFRLQAAGDRSPFARVLEFLARAETRAVAPADWRPKKAPKTVAEKAKLERQEASETFPGPCPDTNAALPIRLFEQDGGSVVLSHWADESSRSKFKLYAGNRSALDIADAMLGRRDQLRERRSRGKLRGPVARGVAQLWRERKSELVEQPFSVLTPLGGSFNLDPRGGWTALDAGYSPNDHHHRVEGSPVLEVLAAWGLEHARPDEFGTRRVLYAAWQGTMPPILARAAISGKLDTLPQRRFSFKLKMTGKNKIVTFAREETQP